MNRNHVDQLDQVSFYEVQNIQFERVKQRMLDLSQMNYMITIYDSELLSLFDNQISSFARLKSTPGSQNMVSLPPPTDFYYLC